MKLETSSQRLEPKQSSDRYERSVGYSPDLTNPELGIKSGAEHYEQKGETSSIMDDVSYTTSLPTPVINDPTVDDSITIGDAPLVASDDDLIEKEWVEKAKQIVEETRDNPHQREEAVNKLQGDYLKKRYGKELGVTK